MSYIELFCWGFLGSLSVEFIHLYNEISRSGSYRVPSRYKHFSFWAVRLVVSFIAGALTIAHGAGVQSSLVAFNIGASAPLLINAAAKGSAKED